MRRLLVAALAAAVSVAVAVAGPAGAHTVTSGVLIVGQGAAGVKLGMNRSQVIAAVGKPVYANDNGYMQFTRDASGKIFGVYLSSGKRTARVHLLIVAENGGTDFKLSDGNAIFAPGGLKRLSKRYGNRLKFHNDPDNGPLYELVTHSHGKRVLTDFTVSKHSLSSRVFDVSILYASG